LADLAMTPGIGEKIAEIIFNHLQRDQSQTAVDMQTGEIL
jgi:Holliday junction resolvasome RuvABC DNA-binding subunit